MRRERTVTRKSYEEEEQPLRISAHGAAGSRGRVGVAPSPLGARLLLLLLGVAFIARQSG